MMIPPPSLMQNQFNNQQMSSPNIGQHAQLLFSNSIPPPQLNQHMNGNNNTSTKFSSPNNQQQAKNPPALMSLMSLNPYGASNANQNQQLPLATPLMSIPPPTIIHQGTLL